MATFPISLDMSLDVVAREYALWPVVGATKSPPMPSTLESVVIRVNRANERIRADVSPTHFEFLVGQLRDVELGFQ